MNELSFTSDATASREFSVGTLNGEAFWITVKLRDVLTACPSLSITGCIGVDGEEGCGQIHHLLADAEPSNGWTRHGLDRMAFIWSTYHLNDMKAGCIHQQDAGLTYATHEGHVCPICDYRIGTAWKYRPLPETVLNVVRCYLTGSEGVKS